MRYRNAWPRGRVQLKCYQFHSSSSSNRLRFCFGAGAGTGAGVRAGVRTGPLVSGTSTLPRPSPASSSSRSDCALGEDGCGDVESGESVAAKGLEVIEKEEGTGCEVEVADGEASAAKIELDTSEMRREARFWPFENLCACKNQHGHLGGRYAVNAAARE